MATIAISCCAQQKLGITLSDSSPFIKSWDAISPATENVKLGINSPSNIMKAPSASTNDDVFVKPEGNMRHCQLEEMISDSPYYGTLYVGYSDTIYISEDEKTVYLPDLVLMPAIDTHYIKGTITEGDIHNGTITIENRQPYGYNVQNLLYVAAIEMEDFNIYLQDVDSFEFKIVNDTIVNKSQLLGAVDAANNLYIFSRNYSMAPILDEQLVKNEIPEGMVKKSYQLINTDSWDPSMSQKQIIDVARDGDDFYFYGMSGLINDEDLVPVKGTLKNGNVVLEANQYLGMVDNMFVFFNIGEIYEYEDEYGERIVAYRLSSLDNISLAFDESTSRLDASGGIGFGFTLGTYRLFNYIHQPHLEPFSLDPVVIPEEAEKARILLTTEANPGSEYGTATLLTKAIFDDEVYFGIPLWCNCSLSIKGNIEGDKLMIKYPQYLGKIEGTDYFLSLGIRETIEDWGFVFNDFYAVEGEGTMEWSYDQLNQTASFDSIMVVTDINNYVQANYNHPVYKNFTEAKPEIPSDAIVNEYTLMQYATYDNSLEQIFKGYVATKGNDYYFMYLDPQDSTAVVKGTLADGKIRIHIPQYIGGGINVEYIYPGMYYTYISDWGDEVTAMRPDPSQNEIIFNYDPATGVISNDGLIVFAYANGEMNPYGHYKSSFTPYVEKPATPANPSIEEVYYDDYLGSYGMTFFAKAVDTEGNYIDVDKLTYRIYIDDQLYTFSTDKYRDITSDTTDIPFDFSDRQFYYSWEDGYHWLSIYDEGQESYGVQIVFTLDGKEYKSDIVKYYMQSHVTDAFESQKQPVAIEYYDLSGRKVANPSNGFFIRKATYSDNTTKAEKVLINK